MSLPPDPGPIRRPERDARLARLTALLAEARLDALVLEPGASLAMLSPLRWHLSERLTALVVLAGGGVFWIAPAFEVARLERQLADPEEGGPLGPVLGWQEDESPFDRLVAELGARGARRVAVDPRARAFVVQELLVRLGAEALASGRGVLRALRSRKDAHEVALLERAACITKAAIEQACSELVPGTTDRELDARVRALQEEAGLRDTWALAVFAEDAADPHAEANGRRLAPGDFVLLDTGGALHGYQSDVTRTFVFGREPSDAQRRAWETVREAQRAGFAAVRPGTPCREVDRAARAVIEAAGYGDGYAAFSHRLGHGIGTEGHEEPCLDGAEEALLEVGMCFSDEPGIYLPGEFGLRIEDVLVVTEDGARPLGGWQQGPESPRSAPVP